MKLNEIKLQEARQDGLNYLEKRHTKTQALQKVILELEGSNSAVATRLAKRYERLDRTAKMLSEKRDELNNRVKQLGDEMFSVEDALATRVINTVSYTMMLTAAQKAEQKDPKYSTDFEGAFKALTALVPELEEKAAEILKQYTTLVKQKDTPVQLKVGARVKEGLGDLASSLYNTVRSVLKNLMSEIKSWGRDYDSRLKMVQRQFPVQK